MSIAEDIICKSKAGRERQNRLRGHFVTEWRVLTANDQTIERVVVGIWYCRPATGRSRTDRSGRADRRSLTWHVQCRHKVDKRNERVSGKRTRGRLRYIGVAHTRIDGNPRRDVDRVLEVGF